MRKSLIPLVACLLVTLLAFTEPAPKDSYASIVEPLMSQVYQMRMLERDGSVAGAASAVAIDSRGYLLTCYHCTPIGYGWQVQVDGQWYTCRPIDNSPINDLALIKIEGAPALHAAKVSSVPPRVGDMNFAVGNAFDLGIQARRGMIGRLHVSDEDEWDSVGDLIQTDAQINHGDSGGGLFNGDGELIGINESIFSIDGRCNTGLGFCVPIGAAQDLLDLIPSK